MTLAELRLIVQNKVNFRRVPGATSTAVLDSWINAGVVDVLLKTACNINKATLSVTSGTNEYTIDTDIMLFRGASIEQDSTSRMLRRVSAEELLRKRNTESEGASTCVAFLGSDLLLLYPTPDSAATITMYYVPRPSAMSSGAHDPSSETYGGVPLELHRAIEYYAVWQGAEYVGDRRGSLSLAKQYREAYEREIGEARSHTNRRFGKLPRATLAPDLGSRFSDRSVYP